MTYGGGLRIAFNNSGSKQLTAIALSIYSNSAENWEGECDVKVSPKVSDAVNHWGRHATEKNV